jgi:membrane protein
MIGGKSSPLGAKGKAAKIRRAKVAAPRPRLPRGGWRALRPGAFAICCVSHFIEDRCLVAASALSYATIVSLIPLTAIVLAIFSGFSVFSGARDRFLLVLLDHFAPDIGEHAAWWFQYLATNAAKTTVLGSLALVVTAILLLATIEDHLQIIWRVSRSRPWWRRVLAYWVALTLGPVLLGVGFSLPGFFDSLAEGAGAGAVLVEHATAAWLTTFARVISFALEAFAFALLYCLIPNCRVRARDGIGGAILAAALLEVLKAAFAFFVARFSSYGTVYGALAGIPIFLLWMYIFWAAVLFGAEVAAALGSWRLAEARMGDVAELSEPRPGASRSTRSR